MKTDFQPVLIGSDRTVYGLARSFHMEYGKKSVVFCRSVSGAMRGSRIISETVVDSDLMGPKFVSILTKFAKNWYKTNPDIRLLLVTPASDSYAELVSRGKTELAKLFDLDVPEWKLYREVTDKVKFYRLCEKYGLDYPQFVICGPKNHQNLKFSFEFPVVVKPVDSALYWRMKRFDGYKKVYFADNETELGRISKLLFGQGYTGELIIQEKIPNNLYNQYDITLYSGQKSHTVQFSQLFQAIFEDNNPLTTGVFNALMPTANPELESKIAKFLDRLNYQGVSGLNIMIDPRDQKPKVLELNARFHGESYSLTASGNNLAKILVEDIYHGKKIVKNTDAVLWKNVPKFLIKRFAPDSESKAKAMQLKTVDELWYKPDLSPARLAMFFRDQLTRARAYCRNK